jgi:hypothetical protein
MRDDVAYPPLDILKPVAEAVWIVDGEPIKAGGLPLPVRMTVVQLSTGDLLLYSPTRYTPGLRRTLDRLGPIRHLVAPNVAHWMFLRDWQRACPGATSWGVPGLRDRAQVRAAGVRIDRELGSVPPPEWSREVDQVFLKAAFFAEVDLFHRPSRTLMVADIVLNVEGRRMPTLPRLMAGVLGILEPDGRAPLYLRLLLRTNRRAVAEAAARLVGFEPRRVIVSHGRILEQNAPAQLRHSLRWLGSGNAKAGGPDFGPKSLPGAAAVGTGLAVGVGLVLGINLVVAASRQRRADRRRRTPRG